MKMILFYYQRTISNYKLVFNTRHKANIETYPIFNEEGHYTTDSLVETLENFNKDKVIMIQIIQITQIYQANTKSKCS